MSTRHDPLITNDQACRNVVGHAATAVRYGYVIDEFDLTTIAIARAVADGQVFATFVVGVRERAVFDEFVSRWQDKFNAFERFMND